MSNFLMPLPWRLLLQLVSSESNDVLKDLTPTARNVIAMAADEARQMNHDFVGTEHLLLGILAQKSDIVHDVLKTMGVDADKIRREIERLVQRGTKPVTVRVLPLTPRARKAIQIAIEGASNFDTAAAGTEHLLLGLVHEAEGIACQVLLNLGVRPDDLQARVLKIRIAQMKVVERSVRPVRASTPRKRKMREELLAHLSAIYDQEYARLQESAAALEAALQRFGDPIELARELDADLPFHERISHFVERFMQYRAPESAARFSLRMALYTTLLLSVISSLVVGGIILRYGWIEDMKTVVRVMVGIVVLTPPAIFVAWLAYIKMRDALWGTFGSRKSLVRMLTLDGLIAAVAMLYVMGLVAVARWDFAAALDAARSFGWLPVVSAIASVFLARTSGPTEIRDTIWALLDIKIPSQGGDATPPHTSSEPA